MRIGFGIGESVVSKERAGGGRFSSLLRQWLLDKGHKVFFDLSKKYDIDVIYDAAIYTPVEQIQRYQEKGVPVIYRMDSLGKTEDRSLYVEKCISADCTVYQSKFCQRCVETFTEKKTERSAIIYNGVLEQPDVSSVPHKRAKVLVYFRPQNAWGRRLGGSEWLEVLERYQKEFGYEIVCIGKDKKLPRPQLHELMKECDVFIHSSYYEACSNALLEAMSCGCATIATDDSGNAELVGPNGCLVKTRPATRNIDYNQFTHKDCDFLPIIEMDTDHAYEQLKRCFSNLQYFKGYSLSRIKNHFTIEKQAQTYLNLMEALVGG